MSTTVLETKNLTKYYGKRLALDHLSIQIPRGSICGFLGRNGAGKTTAIKLMLGFLRPTAGSACVLGCDSLGLTPDTRGRVGYVTEGHRLFRWMTIDRLEKFQSPFFPDQWNSDFFAEMIDYFGLSRKQKIKQLSNGQRAQVSLALTLAPNPELLIMDDPTLGLDAAIRRQFLEGMIQLIMKQGRTVLFSSHILGDVERVCDRILVLDKGVLRADCTLEQFRQSVKKVKLAFPNATPGNPDIPGLLHYRQNEEDLELILVGTSEADLRLWAEANQVSKLELAPMNLEDQFIEFTAPEQAKRQFQWETIYNEIPGPA